MDYGTFDYVIVGAGSAGCVLAARLTEDPGTKVLLLEAGGRDTNFWVHIPIGYGKTIADPRVNWKYESEPNPALNGRCIYLPRGKVLGGSSSINGLIYIRGQAQDYDLWRQMGNPGWSYADVLPYFRKSEDNENGADSHHGAGGPLSVSNLTERNPLCQAFIASAGAAGIARNDDFNGAVQEGAGFFQATIRKGRRASTARAFLNPAKARPNLTILTEATTDRLTMDGRRITGVAFRRGGVAMTATARREVILCGGTLKSPQILMLSGIGPAAHLAEMGIAPVHDLPGVGQNLQDHYGAMVSWRCNQPITLNDVMLKRWKQALVGLQWLLLRRGPLSVPAGQASIFARALETSATPDVQYLFQSFSGGYYEDGLFPFSAFSSFICPLRPESRGELRLRSPDPDAMPRIFTNYLSAEAERRVAIAGFRLLRRIAAQHPLAGYIVNENTPGSKVETDEQILAHFRDFGGCVSHQVGTCKMGTDAMAVVDPRLKVFGIEGLRVVDASVMPRLISGNTNAPTIMIAEKAADMIREDARSTRQ